ncbi:endonuclease III [Alloscardovia theropitheci]|uniref:Endonuclease III n=1 Tax=Alloscardovia theropitheci TaxID=2496842 RepID=A0A4R0QZ74_9BIFI|nr:endonuclease III [Alloscardovia theropitheci]TCD53886.1 endonuclease III [Alloscardovia theropitheci]
MSASRETARERAERIHNEYEILCREIPDPRPGRNFSNSFELLIATMMSAQTTDVRVNEVTPELFRLYPTAQAMAHARVDIIGEIIHSIGFWRVKAQHAVEISQALIENFDGDVPSTMEELVTLPGVGRKTANVVLGHAFGAPGFPVDTHVIRLTKRLRWRTDWRKTNPDPGHIEKEITRYFEPSEWKNVSDRLILFGRSTCHARNPKCESCPLNQTCPSYGLYTK